MQADRFEAAFRTDTGRVRDHNEDAALSRPDLGLFAVADGMGGHAAGDYASGAIVAALDSVGLAASLEDLEARVLERLEGAHHAIAARAAQLGGTVGATVVALMVHEDEFACAWAGDSRLYRMRDGVLSQVSTDHTEVQDLIDAGTLRPEEAATWPRRNVITRAVGVTGPPTCDVARGRVALGDLFLLCSDGLTEHVGDAALAERLRGGGPAEAICEALVEETLAAGAVDNVTCVVVRAARDLAAE
ncbi:serine/threonine-protein phosphatase [Jannaschia sp. Os4]|uniref:PP2C family protein-serine/threonine phosphatase n=1 Tax=Jannaschia sp. Os4 TaxID=2807617 RepID=UPI0019392897|nr:protein phosphatase 2C domain-containing protein [Jannaschia sp. Os4]MBM2578073.1 serine/threonine-protein phosphatase [Jannaschia sp. Os4]